MVGYKNPIDEIILKLLKPGDNNLSYLLEELYFLSEETIAQRLFYMNNRGIIIINFEKKSIYFSDKYAKVVSFNERNHFIEALSNYLYKNYTLPDFVKEVLTKVGFFNEYRKAKIEGKIDLIDTEKYFIKCLNSFYKDTFYKEVRSIDFIYKETNYKKEETHDGK